MYKLIFSARSGTLDIKTWNEWNYKDLSCVMCKVLEESFEHFMNCEAYGKSSCKTNWMEIFGNDVHQQNVIAREIQRRHRLRKIKLEEVGLPPTLAPLLQRDL